MSAFWHPLSAVYLDEPRALASPAVLRFLLAGEKRAVVRYAGDRMWPAVKHGDVLSVAPLGARKPEGGEIVLAVDRGIVDVWRAEEASGEILGRVEGERPQARPGGWTRTRLDLAEAWRHLPDSADAAEGVRDKYDDQAVHYGRTAGDLDADLSRRLAAVLAPGSRVLVAGSGSGREAFALEALGYEVVGVDFSSRMIEVSRDAATKRGSRVRFERCDFREIAEPDRSLAAVIFTYDAYSLVPRSSDRVAVLRRFARALRPEGVLFLSARRSSSWSQRLVLSLQWLAARRRGRPAEWGDSHTRWLDASGNLRRSFIHVFSDASLRLEARRAGFEIEAWRGGHGLCRKHRDA